MIFFFILKPDIYSYLNFLKIIENQKINIMTYFAKEHYYQLNIGSGFLRPCTSEGNLPSSTIRNNLEEFKKIGPYKYR